MPSFVWLIKHIVIGVAAVALMTAPSWASLTEQTRHTSESESPAAPAETPPQAQSQSGTVRIKFVKAGLIVGVGSGSGTLTFRGRTFQLSVGGVDIGSVGITTVQMAGTASNLNSGMSIEDFAVATVRGIARPDQAWRTPRPRWSGDGVIVRVRANAAFLNGVGVERRPEGWRLSTLPPEYVDREWTLANHRQALGGGGLVTGPGH